MCHKADWRWQFSPTYYVSVSDRAFPHFQSNKNKQANKRFISLLTNLLTRIKQTKKYFNNNSYNN